MTRHTAGEIIAAADIGGTHITAGLVDIKDRSLVPDSFVRLSVDASQSAEQIIERWALALRQTIGELPVSKIGVAMPGPFDYDGGISYMKDQDKYESLYGLNVKELLAAQLNVTADSLSFFNDAASFLSGELFAADADMDTSIKAISVTLGTGLGTAVYNKGIAASADLWALPFKEHTAEYYISSKWFVKEYEERAGYRINGVKELLQPGIFDKEVALLFQTFSYNLADFIIRFIEKEEPQIVIIGGNISKAQAWFFPAVKRFVAEVFPAVRIKVSDLGEIACLYGAAAQAVFSKVE